MKTKLLFAFIFIFTIFSSFAQDNLPKRSLLLGGDLSFNSYKVSTDGLESNKYSAFSVSPTVGVAVRDNLFIGANFGFSFYKNQNYFNNQDSTKKHSYSYGIFARKYKTLKHNFYIFLQGNIIGNNSNISLLDNNISRNYYWKQFGINASLSPGISYAINSKLQLETGFNNVIMIGYNETKSNDNISYAGVRKESSFGGSTSLNNFSSQLYFGFRLLLQKKDKMVASK